MLACMAVGRQQQRMKPAVVSAAAAGAATATATAKWSAQRLAVCMAQHFGRQQQKVKPAAISAAAAGAATAAAKWSTSSRDPSEGVQLSVCCDPGTTAGYSYVLLVEAVYAVALAGVVGCCVQLHPALITGPAADLPQQCGAARPMCARCISYPCRVLTFSGCVLVCVQG
jgi:hypothetical protein